MQRSAICLPLCRQEAVAAGRLCAAESLDVASALLPSQTVQSLRGCFLRRGVSSLWTGVGLESLAQRGICDKHSFSLQVNRQSCLGRLPSGSSKQQNNWLNSWTFCPPRHNYTKKK